NSRDDASNVGSFFDFAEVCQSLSQTHSRLQMAALPAHFLARPAPAAGDLAEAMEMVRRRRRDQPEPALTLTEVSRAFEEIAEIEGRSSRRRKLEGLHDLFARMTALEAKYAAKVLIGEMRPGMTAGM